MDWKWGAILILGVAVIVLGISALTEENTCPLPCQNQDGPDDIGVTSGSGKYSPAEVEKNVFEFIWDIHELHLEGGDEGEYMLIKKSDYSALKARMYDLYVPNWEKLNEEYERNN